MLQIMQTVNQDWDELKHTLRSCDREELEKIIFKYFRTF